MTEKLGEAVLELTTDDRALEKGIAGAERKSQGLVDSFERHGKRARAVGGRLSVAVTAPIAAMAVTSVNAHREQAKAVAGVEAALKSMGDGAGFTSKQLQDMASQLQAESLFGDEEILDGVTANLLTFGNVSGDVFTRAQQLSLDLSARLGTDLQGSAIMVGKALNDPITGLTALTRVGITFSEQQKDQIKAMAEAGDVAGAQALMLSELERQYSGQAAAAAEADGGVIQLKNTWGDIQEEFGAVIGEILPDLIGGLRGVAEWLQGLDDDTKRWVVGIGLGVAAIGPLLIALGAMASGVAAIIGPIGTIIRLFGMLGPAISLVGKAMMLLAANPVFLVIGAAVAAIYLAWQNWDKIKPIIDAVGSVISQWWTGTVEPVLNFVGDMVRKVVGIFSEYFGTQLSAIVDGITALMNGDFKGAWEAAQRFAMAPIRAIMGLLDALVPNAVESMRGLYTGVKMWLQDKLGAVFEWVREKVAAVEASFGWLFDRVVGNSWVPDLIDAIASHFDRLGPEMVDDAESATGQVSQSFADMAQNAVNSIDGIVNKIQRGDFLGALQNAIGLLGRFGEVFSSSSGGGFGGFLSGLANSLGSILGSGSSGGFAGGFATGGLIPKGQFGIVGERGPEPVFANSRGAMVLPNQSMQNGSFGGGVTINFNGPVSNPEQVRRSAAQAGAALSRAVASGNRGI